ncbi:MAG TPA: class I SAM-dependent methyltransferase [Verrucomicrobiae bacterium]|nr:class I SAM-dependent methyltransferase [Verrucomicrobiae bacterium]
MPDNVPTFPGTTGSPRPELPRLRLRVSAAAESIVRSGHPWLFADSIREQNRTGQLGELAVVYDRKNEFLAIGLFDPDSPIRVRILHAGKPQTINSEWWQKRLREAFNLRKGLFDENTTGYRCINGESDDWPGLVVDRYGATYVVKLYSAVWLPGLTEVISLLKSQISNSKFSLEPSRLVLRLSRNIKDLARAKFSLTDGQIVDGPPLTETVTFLESGLRFEADVLRGQKTGFFLDQRENRRDIGTLAQGRTVLNAFSFSGGFSLYAARGGASCVTDLDISMHALENAKRNFKLNASIPSVARCTHDTIQADAFDWLDKRPQRKFDLVILDPPSLAKRESERVGAIAAYRRLAMLGINLVAHNGVLAASSCSAHVNAQEFFEAVRQAAAGSERKFTELRTTGHAQDHPAKFPEADYLKTIYLSFP